MLVVEGLWYVHVVRSRVGSRAMVRGLFKDGCRCLSRYSVFRRMCTSVMCPTGVVSTGGYLLVNVCRCMHTGGACRRMYIGVRAAGACIQVLCLQVKICSWISDLRICRHVSPWCSRLQ